MDDLQLAWKLKKRQLKTLMLSGQTSSTSMRVFVSLALFNMVVIGNYRFKPAVVKDTIRQILQEKLQEKQYSSDQVTIWTKEISNAIIQRLKGT